MTNIWIFQSEFITKLRSRTGTIHQENNLILSIEWNKYTKRNAELSKIFCIHWNRCNRLCIPFIYLLFFILLQISLKLWNGRSTIYFKQEFDMSADGKMWECSIWNKEMKNKFKMKILSIFTFSKWDTVNISSNNQ
jgi:hypothetical protein